MPNNFQDKANFIWQVAYGILRGTFKQHEYVDVNRHGTIHVLRKGIQTRGCRFHIAFIKSTSGINLKLRDYTKGTASASSINSSTATLTAKSNFLSGWVFSTIPGWSLISQK